MKKVFAILFFLTIDQFAFCQQEGVVQMQIVDEDTRKKNSGGDSYGLSLKFNPLLFLRGDVPIYIEYGLTSRVGVEVGAGITFTDYLAVDFISNTFSNQSWKSNIGYSARIDFKIYASYFTYQAEGAFFAIGYRHQRYSRELLDNFSIDNTYFTDNNDFKLAFGYVEYFADNIYIEPYIGVGVRYKQFDEVSYVYDSISGFNVYEKSKLSKQLPFFYIGFKLGVSLN